MYPIPSAAKALFESEQKQILRITGTDKNGVSISITDEDIVLGSFNIDRCSCNGEKLEVGTAIASEMTFKLDNYDGRYNSVVFEGTELFAEIGIADWTQDNPSVYWIPCGYFTCYDQPRSLSTITIHALDRMARFDKLPPASLPWTTQGGANMTTSGGTVIEFLTSVVFPVRVVDLVTRICTLCNVPMATLSRLNSTYTIPSMPELQQPVTFRNLIQWCAGIMCSNAWIDWNGVLNFSWENSVSNADYYSTTANRFSSDIYENDLTFTGVSYTNTQGVTIVSGSAGYTLDLTGNYLAANGLSTILPNIRNYISNYLYCPFSASVINAPYLWPMDRIQVRDKTNITRRCLLTNVNFGINSTTELKSNGETAQTNSAAAPSGVTNEQAFLVEKATQYASDHAIDSMTQEEIFNKLTNNGQEQALILYNGRLYLNATYINTGTLVADLLKAGILRPKNGNTNNYWNMDTGEFSLKSNGSSNGITYNNGVLDINASNIKAGVLSDAAGVNTWNMQTGDMNVTGSFTATTEIDGDTYTLKLQDNQLGLYVNNQLRGYIGWDELLGLGIHAYAGSSTVLDASITNSYGELTGGSYVRANKNGDIDLIGRRILVGEVDDIPQDGSNGTITYVKSVNFNSSSVTYGHITVKNGIIVDWD